MKTNQGKIIFAERGADYGRLRSVLREWGYRETEIQHLLREELLVQTVLRSETADQSSKIPHGVS